MHINTKQFITTLVANDIAIPSKNFTRTYFNERPDPYADVPFFSIIVLEPSSGLNNPLHVASPDCATLYSTSPEPPEPLSCLWDVVRSYIKHLNRSSVDIGMPLLWWTRPTRNLYEPSFHPAMHSTSSTKHDRSVMISVTVIRLQNVYMHNLPLGSIRELLQVTLNRIMNDCSGVRL